MTKKDDDPIPEEAVNKLMIDCGRRCCVCKRYRPTKLQVHHVRERAKGGTHDPDNLVVICFSCHSDVHTHVPFARRFTQEELKGHRDILLKQVAEGVFAADDTDDTDEVIRQVVRSLRESATPQPQLTTYATEILLGAADAPGSHQGFVVSIRTREGTSMHAGQKNLVSDPQDARLTAGYKNGLEQLVQFGLAERMSERVYHGTYNGYLLADELKARGEEALSE